MHNAANDRALPLLARGAHVGTGWIAAVAARVGAVQAGEDAGLDPLGEGEHGGTRAKVGGLAAEVATVVHVFDPSVGGGMPTTVFLPLKKGQSIACWITSRMN